MTNFFILELKMGNQGNLLGTYQEHKEIPLESQEEIFGQTWGTVGETTREIRETPPAFLPKHPQQAI